MSDRIAAFIVTSVEDRRLGGRNVVDYRLLTGPDLPWPARERINAWLAANGLDPMAIPETGKIDVLDGQITVRERIGTEKGGWLREPDGNGLATRERTVPLVEPWPADNFGLGAP